MYTYFQIPLMLIVFLPSLDGLRQEWYDASASLGGRAWSFWRHVGGPILAPSFLGSLLLLFTNAFSAYATAAALISQGARSSRSRSRGALQSEVVLGQENVGKALALGMIVVVSLVMIAVCLDPAACLAVGPMTIPGASSAAASEGGAGRPAEERSAPRSRPARRRIAILVLVLGYLLLPLFAMLEFSTRGAFGAGHLDAYAAILDDQNVVDGVVDVAPDRGADRRRDARSCWSRRWSGPSSGSRECAGSSSSCACCRSRSRRS